MSSALRRCYWTFLLNSAVSLPSVFRAMGKRWTNGVRRSLGHIDMKGFIPSLLVLLGVFSQMDFMVERKKNITAFLGLCTVKTLRL